MQTEKEELLHTFSLEKEDMVGKYESEKLEAQEELEAIIQVRSAVLVQLRLVFNVLNFLSKWFSANINRIF